MKMGKLERNKWSERSKMCRYSGGGLISIFFLLGILHQEVLPFSKENDNPRTNNRESADMMKKNKAKCSSPPPLLRAILRGC